MSTDVLREAFEPLKDLAKKDGVEVEMLAVGGERLALAFSKRKMQTFESSESRTAGLRVVDGPAQGYASTENLSADSLVRCYREALQNARMLRAEAEGPPIPLAEPSSLTDAMTDLFVEQAIDIEKKMEVARDLEGKALAADPRVQSVPYSRFSEGAGWIRVLNSRGLDRFHRTSGFSGYTYVLAKDGETSKMDGDAFFTRDFGKVNVDEVVQEAVRRTVARLGARKIKTGHWPVLLDRDVAPSFLSMLLGSLSAKSVLENKSLLKGKAGEAIASSVLTIIDDPFERGGTGGRPFDDEGSPSRKTPLIEKGVLQNFFTNLELAAKMNLPHTASASRGPSSEMGVGPSNIVVERGLMTREQMLSSAPRLLWITELTGSLHAGFNSASGNFSVPAEGFLVENGTIVGPVDQFVISGHILDLMKKVTGVGETYNKPGSSVLVPDLMISELSIAGES